MTSTDQDQSFGYPWYHAVEGDGLAQGDILANCPLISLTDDMSADALAKLASGKGIEHDPLVDTAVDHAIVMTQSCDLDQGKVDIVMVCRLFTLTEIAAANQHFAAANTRENIRKGLHFRYHMLNKCTVPGLEREISVVDLSAAFGLPLDFAKKFAAAGGARRRLLPPYREQLAQAFARFYMRVGLPVDIPRFK